MSTPKEHFTITQDGEDREIFMSFGLLNEITTLLGDPAVAASVYFQPELRENVLVAALHERSKTGKVINRVEGIDDVEISVDQIEELLAWEVEHAIAFFARSIDRVGRVKGQLEKFKVDMSTLSGSQGSPSKKQSSGRSR